VAAVALKVQGGRISRIEYCVEGVDERWPHDPRLLLIYQNYAHLAMQQAMTRERKDGLQYMSSRDCGRCHLAQYHAWLKTPHARAYSTLAAVRREGDPNCLACHTSGFGARNGFSSVAATPALANVNCQDCHRIDASQMPPSADSSQAIRDKPRRLDENTCEACHTQITAPKFNFKDRVQRIKCPHD
jgi:nitrate/TMAO reductase-like tetraheme cytochrome c subunit